MYERSLARNFVGHTYMDDLFGGNDPLWDFTYGPYSHLVSQIDRTHWNFKSPKGKALLYFLILSGFLYLFHRFGLWF